MNEVTYMNDPVKISKMCVNGGKVNRTDENMTIFSYNGGCVIVGNNYLDQISPRRNEPTIENMTGIKFGIKGDIGVKKDDSYSVDFNMESDFNGNNDGSYSGKVDELSHLKGEKGRYYEKNPFTV